LSASPSLSGFSTVTGIPLVVSSRKVCCPRLVCGPEMAFWESTPPILSVNWLAGSVTLFLPPKQLPRERNRRSGGWPWRHLRLYRRNAMVRGVRIGSAGEACRRDRQSDWLLRLHLIDPVPVGHRRSGREGTTSIQIDFPDWIFRENLNVSLKELRSPLPGCFAIGL